MEGLNIICTEEVNVDQITLSEIVITVLQKIVLSEAALKT
jgi:hypothetical protein